MQKVTLHTLLYLSEPDTSCRPEGAVPDKTRASFATFLASIAIKIGGKTAIPSKNLFHMGAVPSKKRQNRNKTANPIPPTRAGSQALGFAGCLEQAAGGGDIGVVVPLATWPAGKTRRFLFHYVDVGSFSSDWVGPRT